MQIGFILRMFLFLSACEVLHASIEDHLKRVGDKSGFHQMRNVDFIYMINLDQRPEKFQICLDKLHPFGIEPCRFSAVNGWELSLDAINDVGVRFQSWMKGGQWGTCFLQEGDGKTIHEIVGVLGRNYFCHCMGPGSIGIVLSHLSVLQDAYVSEYETIWVMEDDIEIIRDPHLVSDLIDKLDSLVGKEGWDLLFTDLDTKNNQGEYVPCYSFAWRPNFTPENPGRFSKRWEVGPEFRRIGARYGAYSMIVRRSGMEKILRFFKEHAIFLPYDMEFTLPDGIRLFTVAQDVVSTQPAALTDNGAPNYKNKSNL